MRRIRSKPRSWPMREGPSRDPVRRSWRGSRSRRADRRARHVPERRRGPDALDDRCADARGVRALARARAGVSLHGAVASHPGRGAQQQEVLGADSMVTTRPVDDGCGRRGTRAPRTTMTTRRSPSPPPSRAASPSRRAHHRRRRRRCLPALRRRDDGPPRSRPGGAAGRRRGDARVDRMGQLRLRGG